MFGERVFEKTLLRDHNWVIVLGILLVWSILEIMTTNNPVMSSHVLLVCLHSGIPVGYDLFVNYLA